MKKLLRIIPLFIVVLLLSGCNKAAMVSHNLSQEANYFNVNRRIVFYNGITNEYILSVEGKCSIYKDNVDNQLEVTCKIGEDEYKKHFLGISDNVTYFAEQIDINDVSENHYKVIFKPSAILPDLEVR